MTDRSSNRAMTLDEACRHWGVSQSEVNYITSEFQRKKWWQNNRTLELIEIADEEGN